MTVLSGMNQKIMAAITATALTTFRAMRFCHKRHHQNLVLQDAVANTW